MILGVGIDLVSVGRIEHLMFQFKEKFPQKIFTKNEILCVEKVKNYSSLFYAKRFAAKEAFAKATGLGIGRGIDFKDIEVENGELGAPKIKILNGKEKFLKQHFNCKNFSVHLSLTDENPLASAIVIIEKIS
ncbi:MAG: holo-[acyl-carrier-protein] synthase [Alphaproteobacteria bacterium RIFCSPLOWO2_01_FULL_40_26]|nr:MAG: holo-[acyl-carrier-protein] synthase [Alphaproteobacteria bacterium RIFCSPHIGHO2_02_FULL_40_34]OFW86472.1 MAG: holo-[acyl-carrier-protein] synthase [Alphaproteobacteria bacterium RIFCSPHIGHO2_01_FULL_40_8]OFW95320.1 MAG: holo-[acyl-carrier-protein] synthase [Alphaproteobacteria bacterium RIFCSPLOWO2_01_FULL_40_26]OFX09223.1 MAG: holo-[acyl-carrier-protein] synthase [Alphaproteobacteria bacterium RIFCSPLOWO2_02_FULL_40_19]OFX11578.1 MAG: holo-[acyl-carrier-protein] synthase [Alphaproteob